MSQAPIHTLADLFARSGKRQSVIARETEIAESYLGDLKRGFRWNPSIETVRRLAVALGVDEAAVSAALAATPHQTEREPRRAGAPSSAA